MTSLRHIFCILIISMGLWSIASANIGFLENIGQVTDQFNNKRTDIIARYRAGNGLNMFLSYSSIHYQFTTTNEFYRVDVKLIGANPNPKITKDIQSQTKEVYHTAETQGIAHQYQRITYHDIYPEIDWVFYINPKGKVEHDFIIRPNGNINNIQLQYLGAEELRIDRKGNLIAATKYGTIKEPKPYAYELNGKKEISSNYVLTGNILTFRAAKHQGTLVIDPVIDWATYLGDSEYDEISDVKVSPTGYIYSIGSTNSTSNIATTGAHLTFFQGGSNTSGSDVFICKFDQSGNRIWSTYYGGTNIDQGLSLAFDTAGSIYVAGRTNSLTGIATAGSHQPNKAGTASGYDIFASKFDTAGALLWGTYFGGTGNDGTEAAKIAIDKNNNLYLTGNTQSANGISTPNTFQATRPGSQDGFIAKFTTNDTLLWSTYYGTSAIEFINDLTTDTAGNIIVTGETVSTTGLSTSGSHLEIGNGNRDGFIAKFAPTGQRIWSTYYGGADLERLYAVTTDSINNIYIAGITSSPNGIATANAHQTTIGSAMDGCIAKFDANGTLQWSSYFGGSENDVLNALKFSDNKLYATGWTASPNNIATPDAVVPVFNNSSTEGLLATFSTNGQRLWSTYFGGDITEDPKAIAFTADDVAIIAGRTSSTIGLATTGAHQTTFGGLHDGMLLRIKMCNLPETPTAINGNTTVCQNSVQQYTVKPTIGADAYVWIIPNGWSGNSNTDTLYVTTGADNGEIKVIAINTCGASDTVSLAIAVNASPTPVISRNGNILSVAQSFNSYQWHRDGNPINSATNPTYAVTQNGTYILNVTGPNGCVGISNEITVDNFTSISELSKIGIKVYPNPFGTSLTVNSPIDMTIALTDISGKHIINLEIAKGNKVIDLSGIPDGTYFLNAYDAQSTETLGSIQVVKLEK